MITRVGPDLFFLPDAGYSAGSAGYPAELSATAGYPAELSGPPLLLPPIVMLQYAA